MKPPTKSAKAIEAERSLAVATAIKAAAARRQKVRDNLEILRLRYGPLFAGWADLSDIDLTQGPRTLLNAVVARQAERLHMLEDPRFCTVWWEFARSYSRIREAERSRRDRLFQAALADEWRRRALASSDADAPFRWPTTAAPSGPGALETSMGPQRGVLAAIGYHVGRTGLATDIRRRLLDFVFSDELPPVDSEAYMRTWGAPGSAARLQKLAESLAAFARNAKRRDTDALLAAIRHWQDDLRYLHDRYYRDHFRFAWPAPGD